MSILPPVVEAVLFSFFFWIIEGFIWALFATLPYMVENKWWNNGDRYSQEKYFNLGKDIFNFNLGKDILFLI